MAYHQAGRVAEVLLRPQRQHRGLPKAVLEAQAGLALVPRTGLRAEERMLVPAALQE
jgi:hypothetical protein